jgi:hypothetical protein
MKKSFGVIHAIAECEDCGWRNEQYKNAQATAAIHAEKHQHKVQVDIGLAGSYDGRKEKP